MPVKDLPLRSSDNRDAPFFGLELRYLLHDHVRGGRAGWSTWLDTIVDTGCNISSVPLASVKKVIGLGTNERLHGAPLIEPAVRPGSGRHARTSGGPRLYRYFLAHIELKFGDHVVSSSDLFGPSAVKLHTFVSPPGDSAPHDLDFCLLGMDIIWKLGGIHLQRHPPISKLIWNTEKRRISPRHSERLHE